MSKTNLQCEIITCQNLASLLLKVCVPCQDGSDVEACVVIGRKLCRTCADRANINAILNLPDFATLIENLLKPKHVPFWDLAYGQYIPLNCSEARMYLAMKESDGLTGIHIIDDLPLTGNEQLN